MSGSWLATGLGNGMLMNYGTYLKEDLMKEQQQLDIERMQRVEEIKQMLADKERGARAAEIDKGTEGLIAAKIGNRYAGSDAAVADAAAGRTDAPLTPEQLAVIQQSKDGARGDLSMRDKLEARIDAGLKAGYDMSREMATLSQLTTTEATSKYHDSALDEARRHHGEIEKNVADRTAAMRDRWSAAGAGKDTTLGRDKFNTTDWNNAHKELKEFTTFDDPTNPSGKPKTNRDALMLAEYEMEQFRNNGEEPYKAARATNQKLMDLRELAQKRMESDKSLSLDSAMSLEVRKYVSARNAAMKGSGGAESNTADAPEESAPPVSGDGRLESSREARGRKMHPGTEPVRFKGLAERNLERSIEQKLVDKGILLQEPGVFGGTVLPK